jgi:surface polysaccharide O-acyltransferase-like enzyme
MESNRLVWIDALKFLAIFGIIGIHVSSSALSKEFLFSSMWYQSVFMNSLCRFGIVIFIMASGYLILRKQQPLSVIPKRIKRIVIPFVFWLIIYAIVKVVIKGELGPGWNIIDLISFTLSGFLDPTVVSVQFWYVYMILGLYILSPILSRWIQNTSIKEIEYFLGIWIIISLIQFLNVDTILIDYFRYFTGAIGYFVLGYYLSIKEAPILNDRKSGAILFIAGALITFIGTIVMSFITNDQSLLFIRLGDITPGACLQSVGLYIIIKNTDFENFSQRLIDIITKVSKYSYGIYLSNILVIKLLETAHIIKLGGFASIQIIIYAVIVLIISYLISFIMERIPILEKFA